MSDQRQVAQKLDYPGLSARLGRVQHFSHLSETDRERIVRAGQIQSFRQGDYIFQEGDDCAGLFVLFKGRVHLSKLGLQGQNCIIRISWPSATARS